MPESGGVWDQPKCVNADADRITSRIVGPGTAPDGDMPLKQVVLPAGPASVRVSAAPSAAPHSPRAAPHENPATGPPGAPCALGGCA